MVAQRNGLALVQANGSDAEWWGIAQQQANMLVKTGFLPSSIKTPEQALAIMMKGRELGVPPMYALSNITVIQGKPTCNAELMLALVRRDHGSNVIRIARSDNESCTIQWKTWGQISEYTFTMDDAKRAGLLQNQTWQKYPAAMLRARCISAVCRMAFPESIAGMYTAEELGGPAFIAEEDEMPVASNVRVIPVEAVDHETGEIIDAAPMPSTHAETAQDAMTEPQKRKIWAMAQDLGMTVESLHTFAAVESLSELTKQQASNLIERLDAAIGAAMEATDQPQMLNQPTGTAGNDRYSS